MDNTANCIPPALNLNDVLFDTRIASLKLTVVDVVAGYKRLCFSKKGVTLRLMFGTSRLF